MLPRHGRTTAALCDHIGHVKVRMHCQQPCEAPELGAAILRKLQHWILLNLSRMTPGFMSSRNGRPEMPPRLLDLRVSVAPCLNHDHDLRAGRVAAAAAGADRDGRSRDAARPQAGAVRSARRGRASGGCRGAAARRGCGCPPRRWVSTAMHLAPDTSQLCQSAGLHMTFAVGRPKLVILAEACPTCR